MRQVTTNCVLQDDDYAFIHLFTNRRSLPYFAAVYKKSGRVYLLSDCTYFNGATPDETVMQMLGFKYSWAFSAYEQQPFISILIEEHPDINNVKIIKEKKELKEIHFCQKGYTDTTRYFGLHGYHRHNSFRHNTVKKLNPKYKFGVELEVEFESEDRLAEFTRKTSNWFYCERDGSLNDYGCEIITIPLRPKDAKNPLFWEQLTRELMDVASTSYRTGLHVHVSKEILGKMDAYEENLGKLLFAYHHHWNESRYNVKICGRANGYHAGSGKSDKGTAVDILGSSVLSSAVIRNEVSTAMKNKSAYNRYFDINITNSNTIEFRKGKGTIDPIRIAMLVEYVELLCKYAVQAKWQNISAEDIKAYLKAKATNEMLINYLND